MQAVELRKRLTNAALAKRFGVGRSTIVNVGSQKRFAKKLSNIRYASSLAAKSRD